MINKILQSGCKCIIKFIISMQTDIYCILESHLRFQGLVPLFPMVVYAPVNG
jgi:hypothetical protein